MIAMFRMIFTIREQLVLDETDSCGDHKNAEISVTAADGHVYVNEVGVSLRMTVKQANDLMFALRKAQYEAKLQRKGGEK